MHSNEIKDDYKWRGGHLYDNKRYIAGTVEYDRDWAPFDNNTWNQGCNMNDDQNGEEKDEDDSINSVGEENSDSDDDAVSATCENPKKQSDETKEGEIVEESEIDDESLRSPLQDPTEDHTVVNR
ncbi:unnamed protein product [Lactuca virosa]|uniref:Uncharacterized protein n=1 Tax=Lactuca virosa TaxID=75947 RepID=A0AAU9LFH4_9ASTR|nr:unnamed protein product [Lactuca virosa]